MKTSIVSSMLLCAGTSGATPMMVTEVTVSGAQAGQTHLDPSQSTIDHGTVEATAGSEETTETIQSTNNHNNAAGSNENDASAESTITAPTGEFKMYAKPIGIKAGVVSIRNKQLGQPQEIEGRDWQYWKRDTKSGNELDDSYSSAVAAINNLMITNADETYYKTGDLTNEEMPEKCKNYDGRDTFSVWFLTNCVEKNIDTSFTFVPFNSRNLPSQFFDEKDVKFLIYNTKEFLWSAIGSVEFVQKNHKSHLVRWNFKKPSGYHYVVSGGSEDELTVMEASYDLSHYLFHKQDENDIYAVVTSQAWETLRGVKNEDGDETLTGVKNEDGDAKSEADDDSTKTPE